MLKMKCKCGKSEMTFKYLDSLPQGWECAECKANMAKMAKSEPPKEDAPKEEKPKRKRRSRKKKKEEKPEPKE